MKKWNWIAANPIKTRKNKSFKTSNFSQGEREHAWQIHICPSPTHLCFPGENDIEWKEITGKEQQNPTTMSDGEYKAGRFKVSAAPESTSIGRFRLIPQGSPFLQRGRFSVIPEEESSPAVSRQGPEIKVEASPEWDFQVRNWEKFEFSMNLQFSRQKIWISNSSKPTANCKQKFFFENSSSFSREIHSLSLVHCFVSSFYSLR